VPSSTISAAVCPPEDPVFDRFVDQRVELFDAIHRLDSLQASWLCDAATGEKFEVLADLVSAVKAAWFDPHRE
jgi:hypothetical protein